MSSSCLTAFCNSPQGLEHTYFTHCSGGMASALQVLEIAHTHYWISDRKAVSPSSSSVSNKGVYATCISPISLEWKSQIPLD